MKVLFASAAHTPDMAAGFLYRALQDLLGTDNVADATDGSALRGKQGGQWANDRPITWCPPHRIPKDGEDDFDLLVATSTFLRDHDWDWLRTQWLTRLKNIKNGGKIVWFDTLDGCNDGFQPPFPVDAVFKREIDPGFPYQYGPQPLSLLCGIPEDWLADPVYGWTDEKPYDVFNVSNAVTTGNPVRWQSLSPTFCTSKRYNTLAGAGVLQPNTVYLHVARQFKLAVCGPGGEGASDNARDWELMSMGCIPIFVQQSCRPRWPWFTSEHCFWCERPEDLPATIEQAMERTDLGAMRSRLKAHILEWHTAKARAQQFLRMIEEDAWRGAPGPWRW